MMTYLEHLSDILRTSFWFVPAVFAFAALTLAFVMMWLDSMFNRQNPRYQFGSTRAMPRHPANCGRSWVVQ
ncbi:MAG: DUF2254 domain-containing protein [Pseudomonadota bacterium]|nr:DUF2254 domain-containing protein [Pseudomonadota bacterium]